MSETPVALLGQLEGHSLQEGKTTVTFAFQVLKLKDPHTASAAASSPHTCKSDTPGIPVSITNQLAGAKTTAKEEKGSKRKTPSDGVEVEVSGTCNVRQLLAGWLLCSTI